jgi:cysteine desulfurase
LGRKARSALDDARDIVAGVLGCEARELIFTSGGSESDNLALRGVAARNKERGNHIICSQVEHHAVLHTCQDLERQGFDVTYLPVDRDGRVAPTALAAALRPETILVSVMTGNNEVGTLEPVREQSSAYFHTDAIQAFGKIPVRVDDLGIDMLSISAHKIYGPKGVGCLYVRMGTRIEPMITGGGHERNRRAGTENVAGIAGLGKAVEIAARDFESDTPRIREVRDRLSDGVLTSVAGARVSGHPTDRLPHHASFVIEDVAGDSLLMRLDREGVYASSGSACTSGSLEPSHVLLAMGFSPQEALGSLRLTVGKRTTNADVDAAVEVIQEAVGAVRG